jgi:hypothetical protein
MVKGRGLSLSDSRQGQVAAVADGIVTRDGRGGPGIESRWGRESPHPSGYRTEHTRLSSTVLTPRDIVLVDPSGRTV